ncbi:protein kinase C delta type [Platysternon megacephalum]|uniref:Protein kinase C delta type n=1 Tax=Platysternon megacephalum TaxID=55544 RepID=A0A4D9E4X1_9SAUR|nr:protein kinase C delta type [Platysternon megacephalum]
MQLLKENILLEGNKMRDDLPRGWWERLKMVSSTAVDPARDCPSGAGRRESSSLLPRPGPPPTELICIDAAARRRRGKDASAAGRGKNEAGWEERNVEVGGATLRGGSPALGA